MVDKISMHKIVSPNTAPERVRKAGQKNDNFFNKNSKQHKKKDEKNGKDEEKNNLEPEPKAVNTFYGRIIDILI